MTTEYKQWLTALKQRIQSAQIKAALQVNAELITLYWELGHQIRQKESEVLWGDKLIPQLSKDLLETFPRMKGFSKRNLFYIRQWVIFYSQAEIVQQPVAQFQTAANQQKDTLQQLAAPLPPLFTSVPWGHHLQIITKCKTLDEALFYISQTAVHGWSRAVLVLRIGSHLYQRQGKAITNFATTLPQPDSDLARDLLKNPYSFDFLTLGTEAKERDIEEALVGHITAFLLELGRGFAYMGRQYRLELEGEAYFLDLLFYHTRLRCYVVIELKAGEFQPGYAGQLNFYLNLVDDFVRSEGDGPTIGLLLCRSTGGKLKAEYALRGINKPIGVSEFELTENIPASLKGKLPTIEEIEAELGQGEELTGG